MLGMHCHGGHFGFNLCFYQCTAWLNLFYEAWMQRCALAYLHGEVASVYGICSVEALVYREVDVLETCMCFDLADRDALAREAGCGCR